MLPLRSVQWKFMLKECSARADSSKSGMKKISSGNRSQTINESMTMKRIYSFMFAAVAAFAAASCAQELENNQVPAGETVTFTAVADGVDTKAALNEETKYSEWEAGDAITVHNGTKGFEFKTEKAGSRATFSYTGNDFGGEKFLAVYPSGKSFDVANKVVKAYIPTWQQAKAGTYNHDAAVAVAYSENDLFNFKNATALLKFTVNTDNVTHVVFHGNGSEAITGDVNITLGEEGVETVQCLETEFTEDKWNEETQQNEQVSETKYGTWVECFAYHDDANKYFAKGQTYYIAVAPQKFEGGVTVKVKIDGGEELVAKTTTKPVETKINTILNLGEIKYEAPATVEKVYLQPGVWSADDAWFSAHFFNSVGDAEDVKMTDEDADGVYEVSVPAGMESVIFCRMNPAYSDFAWNNETETDHVWTEMSSVAIPLADDTKVYYNVTDWEAGEWSDTPQENTPEEEIKTYGICGDLTSWGETEDIPMALVDGKYVAYNVTFASAGGFKIRANNDWVDSDNWGLSATGAVEVGKYYDVITSGGSGNLTIIPGTYDIWFDLDNERIYIMKPGTSITTATKGTPIAPSSDEWYLIGTFNNWAQKDANYKFKNEAGWFVLKNCNISNGGGVKINDGTWDVQRTGSVGLYASCVLSSSGNDFYLPKGVYDIYMDTEATKIYVLFPGETPTTTGSYRLYVKNSTSQSKVVLYAWGGYSTSWPGVELTGTTDVEGYGTCSYLELQKGTNPIVNFLIHNGSEGNKTADQNCSALTVLSTGDLYFEWK